MKLGTLTFTLCFDDEIADTYGEDGLREMLLEILADQSDKVLLDLITFDDDGEEG